MDASTPQTPDLQRQQERKRKRKALLAGGVVLGLGAAVTLAAWSDDVFADGMFNTGGFELQGSTNGTAFEDYDGPGGTPDSAQLTFDLDETASLNMTPGQTVYAPLTIAASPDSNHDGEFKLNMIQASGKYSGIINYRIYSGANSHGENCSEAGVSNLGTAWASGTTPFDPNLTRLTNLTPVGLIGQVLGLVGQTVTWLLGQAGITPPTEVQTDFGLPYAGLGNTPLPVSPDADNPVVQHLCIAANLGGAPVTLPVLDPLNLGQQVPQAIVELADTLDPADDPTRVTWVFTGNSTN